MKEENLILFVTNTQIQWWVQMAPAIKQSSEIHFSNVLCVVSTL